MAAETDTTPSARQAEAQAQKATALTYVSLREANVARQVAWCPDQVPDLSFRGNELGGEVGEALNVIKKLERERHGWRGSRDTVDHLAEELADVVICADLVAITASIDLDAAVVAKFNLTSEKVGLPHRLRLSAHGQGAGAAVPEGVQTVVEPSLVRPLLRLGQVREPNFRDPDSIAHNPFEVGRFDFKRGMSESDNPYAYDPSETVSGHWYHGHWTMGFEQAGYEAEEEKEAAAAPCPELAPAGDETENLDSENKWLMGLLEGRDAFIVQHGLWQDFVGTLPLNAPMFIPAPPRDAAPAALGGDLEIRARQIAAEKMGLIKDPTGSRLPDELWRQALPQAEAEQAPPADVAGLDDALDAFELAVRELISGRSKDGLAVQAHKRDVIADRRRAIAALVRRADGAAAGVAVSAEIRATLVHLQSEIADAVDFDEDDSCILKLDIRQARAVDEMIRARLATGADGREGA